MLAAPTGDVSSLSLLHVSDRQGWWCPCLAVKTTTGDGVVVPMPGCKDYYWWWGGGAHAWL